LTNSEQFIGTLIEEDDEGIRLENPMRIATVYTSETAKTPNVVIFPWNELSKMESVYFDKFHILYYTLPKDNIVNFYKKQLDLSASTNEDEDEDDDTIKALVEKAMFKPTIN